MWEGTGSKKQRSGIVYSERIGNLAVHYGTRERRDGKEQIKIFKHVQLNTKKTGTQDKQDENVQ